MKDVTDMSADELNREMEDIDEEIVVANDTVGFAPGELAELKERFAELQAELESREDLDDEGDELKRQDESDEDEVTFEKWPTGAAHNPADFYMTAFSNADGVVIWQAKVGDLLLGYYDDQEAAVKGALNYIAEQNGLVNGKWREMTGNVRA